MTNEHMKGKTVLVTGATSGHGKACAAALAEIGADVILLGRNREKCLAVQEEITQKTGNRPEILLCNLSSRDDISRAAGEYLKTDRPIHLLINNAGIVNQERKESRDGIEETMAVNYFAMYQLTLLLLDRIKKSAPARIVNISSDTHRIVKLDPGNLEQKEKYSWMKAYSLSKLAIVYFTRELAKRLEGTGVTVNAVDPGPVASNIAGRGTGLVPKIARFFISRTFPKPEKAARTALYVATSPEMDGVTGRYYRFMKDREPRVDTEDLSVATRLWELSARITGVDLN